MTKSIGLRVLPYMAITLIALGCGAKEEQQGEHKMNMQHMETQKTGQVAAIYYTCPMPEHAKVGSDKPGKCSECQMDLVAAVEGTDQDHDYYGCPMAMHSGVRSDKPGVCAECGMDYKPIKLTKVNSDM